MIGIMFSYIQLDGQIKLTELFHYLYYHFNESIKQNYEIKLKKNHEIKYESNEICNNNNYYIYHNMKLSKIVKNESKSYNYRIWQ